MTKLKYTFKSDVLFKLLFTKYPNLLKKLVAELLKIPFENITEFEIKNTEMPPEMLGKKFCRLDIAMTVNSQQVNLEIQVENEGDFPERSLFHWARQYSVALPEGEDYSVLPRTIIIGIVHFKLFKCKEFHSEYQALEVTRHTQLSDRFNVHIFELPKLPKALSAERGLELWLALFRAKTEEDLEIIEKMEVPVMKEAITAYRHVSASPEFQEMERMRSKAGHDEAQALKNATLKGEKRADKKWQKVVDDKDALIAELRARLGEDK
jgi:predicted transposase/invertase (TIGR01784 family)